MIPPTKTFIYVYIHIKAELTETENRMRVTRAGGWRNGEMLVKGYKLPVIR